MMFIELDVLKRRGSNEPPTVSTEILRVDLIQRIRAIEVGDVDGPCVELILDNEEKVICQGTLADVKAALEQVLN